MTNKPPVTETFADVLPRLMRDLQAGVHLGERSAINRLDRRAENTTPARYRKKPVVFAATYDREGH